MERKVMDENKTLRDYVEQQERKIAKMKKKLESLSSVIPQLEAIIKSDKEKWGLSDDEKTK